MQADVLFSQKLALYSCQRALRAYLLAKTWKWLQIWMLIKVQICPKIDNRDPPPILRVKTLDLMDLKPKPHVYPLQMLAMKFQKMYNK